jgi:Putative abortive phage resistance protein AbiGi, antitoxin
VRNQRYVSAELHHFVGKDLPDDDARYDTLLKILRSGLLRPGQLPGVESPQGESDPAGVAFTIQPAAEDTEEMVRAEVVCFCDIPADDLGLHMTKYSHFGISFPKPFLCQQGANPVYYVACDSRAVLSPETDDTLGRLFSAEIRRFLGRNPYFAPGDRDDAWRDAVALHRFARTYMFAFVKPFWVTLAGGEPVPDDDPMNVYMEREWRVLGPVRFALSDVSRVTLPQREYAARFRSDCPAYCGQLTFASPRSGPG